MSIILILYLIGATVAMVLNTGALLADIQAAGCGSADNYFMADLIVCFCLSIVLSAFWPVGIPVVFSMTLGYRHGFQFRRR